MTDLEGGLLIPLRMRFGKHTAYRATVLLTERIDVNEHHAVREAMINAATELIDTWIEDCGYPRIVPLEGRDE